MSRRSYLPNPVNGITDRTYRIVNGGTSARTQSTGVTNLKVLSLTKKGIPNNPIPLDSDGFVPQSFMPTQLLSTLNVVGPLFTLASTQATYVITDFDFRTQYTLAVIGDGSVSRSQDTITYTAPAQKSTNGDGFTLNSVNYNITVGPSVVKPPKILTPVDLANNIPSTYTFTTTAFETLGATQAHTSSTWEVATDIDFVDIVFSTIEDTVNKTSWSVSGLEPITRYYVRVKHTGSVSGDSYWSSVVRFQTGEHVPKTLSQLLPAPNPAFMGLYGASISCNDDGTIIAIGSPGNNGFSGAASGRVFIYTKTANNWVLSQELRDTVTSNEYESEFGYRVKMNGAGTALLVTVKSYNSKGAVVLFTKTAGTWKGSKRFYNANVDNNADFGAGLAMNSTGTVVFIGVPGKTVSATPKAGCIYVYRKTGTTWNTGTLIEPEHIGTNYCFGGQLDCDLTGNTFITSSPTANSLDNDKVSSGIAHIYKYEGSAWVLKTTIEKPIPTNYQYFGTSVSMGSAGDTVIISDQEPIYENQKRVLEGTLHEYNLISDAWVLNDSFSHPVMSGYVYSMRPVMSYTDYSKTLAIVVNTLKDNGDFWRTNVTLFKKINDQWTALSSLSRPPSVPTVSETRPFSACVLTKTGDTCFVGGMNDVFNYDVYRESGLAYIYQ